MANNRVESLDLVRGFAVLGILAINIAGFAGPSIGAISPNLPKPSGFGSEVAFAISFVLFEGKMRALFAILFGASMALFIDASDARGRNGDILQARRLIWLLVFGALHYALFWWGDILFAYAASGLILLMCHRVPQRTLYTSAAAIFILHHLTGFLSALPVIEAEQAVKLGTASAKQVLSVARFTDYFSATSQQELALYRGGFLHILTGKLAAQPFWLLQGALNNFAEYFGLMTLGIALQRHGFFANSWQPATMRRIGFGLTGAGLIMSFSALAWLWPRGFPLIAMDTALRYGLALPHVCMAVGYAALIVLSCQPILQTSLGRRIEAAGRLAFSNYIGTTVVMTAIFYGWGLGLFGKVSPVYQWFFVFLGWAMMLSLSQLWLARWRRGPLEWLWRCLTERQILPNKR